MITTGFAQGLSLLCHMMSRLGIGTVGLEGQGEDPSRVVYGGTASKTLVPGAASPISGSASGCPTRRW